jgi:ABC-type phosphate/phosphonate transport system permease subunit
VQYINVVIKRNLFEKTYTFYLNYVNVSLKFSKKSNFFIDFFITFLKLELEFFPVNTQKISAKLIKNITNKKYLKIDLLFEFLDNVENV